MHIKDFSYELPGHLIAQYPIEPRDACRLLVLPRKQEACRHARFSSLPDFLRPGDRLVFNDTRVIPARLFTRKKTGAKVELFLLEKVDTCTWKALVKPGKRVPVDTLLHLDDDPSILFKVISILPKGERLIQLSDEPADQTVESVMEEYGHIPLPHYIDRSDCAHDRDTYQTVYAAVPGAVAAPTAGLHFTEELLNELQRNEISISKVTLHVGIGTFRPVKVSDPRNHPMHEERFTLSEQAVAEIEKTRSEGGRIIAVGTTVVRVLEHCHAVDGKLLARQGGTRIMILPPYQFGVVDGLITNFHLPCSTLIMLVSAFAGRERVLNAYEEAVALSYRFYSYGDAMFIV